LLVTKYFGDQIEEKEVGGACGTYGGKTGLHTEFLGENRKKETTWKPRLRLEHNIKLDLKESKTAYSGIVYLRTGTRGGLPW